MNGSIRGPRVEQCACELMRILGRTRFMNTRDISRRDWLDAQALMRALRREPIAYPEF